MELDVSEWQLTITIIYRSPYTHVMHMSAFLFHRMQFNLNGIDVKLKMEEISFPI